MEAQKMLAFHSSSTRDKLGTGMQRECVASDNPEGWKGKKIAGSTVQTDLHSWHVLPFSWQQDPSI